MVVLVCYLDRVEHDALGAELLEALERARSRRRVPAVREHDKSHGGALVVPRGRDDHIDAAQDRVVEFRVPVGFDVVEPGLELVKVPRRLGEDLDI